MSIMAFPSSSEPRNYKFNVFSSFHGPDVRKTLLSHMRKQFNRNGITMFDDQGIERSEEIAPSLISAIRESKISIVILSKKYASSSWCLDELLEILKRKKAMKQIVMTIFYGVDPSDVRKQTGDFGIAFDKTCAKKTYKEIQEWRKALTDVSNIAGEDFIKWDNEANMIEKIARDLSNKLNATPSKDFEDKVGLEAHLRRMESLLQLNNKDEAMIVGISGPAGIGKTTIARALQSLHSDRFQLTCFMDLSGSNHSGLHDHDVQLRLQKELLSKVLNQDGTRLCHLNVLPQRLSDLRVLIILDDVNDVKQLDVLAKDTTWFGPGSRVVVTTENRDILQKRGINNTYHVKLPSKDEALEIFCKSAFKQSSPPHGFKEFAVRITHLCGNLPLGLCVMGSSLVGTKPDEWEIVIRRLETTLHGDIYDALRVSFERLHENDQVLFLQIAVFFNYKRCDLVETMLSDDGYLGTKYWLKLLVNKSLIEINPFGEIVMHKLLQQVGRQAICRQEPWKRQILIDAGEIRDVLQYEKGTSSNVSGISFDTSEISEVTISDGAFKRLPNLRFLKVYKSVCDRIYRRSLYRMHIPKKMEFPHRLRLLEWEAYPSKRLPPTFNAACLVELNMQESQLEHLWSGTQWLRNLEKMNLLGCSKLKELPDLSNATNLKELDLTHCESLVEIPSFFSKLHKLESLWMDFCYNIKVIPADMNLASLDSVQMGCCSRLRKFPLMSTHIRVLNISNNMVLEDLPASFASCYRLGFLNLSHNGKLKGITHLPTSLSKLDLSFTDIERIPDCIKDLLWLESLDLSRCRKLASLPELPRSINRLDLSYTEIERIPDCIKDLHQLCSLNLKGCRRLASLPELPGSLNYLKADGCESLESIFSPLFTPEAHLNFINCFKLDGEARRAIIRRSLGFRGLTILPGRQVPAGFYHRAKGNSLTVLLDAASNSRFIASVVISPNQESTKTSFSPTTMLLCRMNGTNVEFYVGYHSECRREHLIIFSIQSGAGTTEMVFEFSSKSQKDFDIIECGVKIWYPESFERGYLVFEDDENEIENDNDHTNRVSGPDTASRNRPRKTMMQRIFGWF